MYFSNISKQHLALAALFAAAAIFHEASGNRLMGICDKRGFFAGRICDEDSVFGIKDFLLFAALGAVLWFAGDSWSLRNKQTAKDEELNGKIKELLLTLEKGGEKIVNFATVNMTFHKQIQELETKLRQTREQSVKKKEEERGTVLQYGKMEMEHQALEKKTSHLQDQKNLLERQMADNERCKAQLEEILLQIKEENKQLEKSATEMSRINNGLNDKVMSLTAHLAAVNCQLVQRENEASQMHKNLSQLTEEKIKMEKQIKSQTDTINGYKNETEDLLLKVQNLQKEVRCLSQEKQNLDCHLQEKDTRLKDHKALLQKTEDRLQEMTKKANTLDGENSQLQDQLRQLRGENEALLRDIDNIKMQKKHQENTNTRLLQQISVLMRWREGVAVGLVNTDKELISRTS